MNEPAPTTSSSSSSSTSVAASTSVKPTLSSSSKPVVTTPSTTIKRSTSTTAPPMTTKPSNGVDTPSPLQPSVATNCDSFYYVKSDNSCENIAKFNGISTARFLSWNPSAGSDCTGLWVNAYACISIIGHTPTSVAPMTTTTGNGIATSPSIQYGMVRNCDSFYMVKSGDTCDKISSSNSITSAQLISWNPTVGSSCGSLWLNTYVCISIVRHTPNYYQGSSHHNKAWKRPYHACTVSDWYEDELQDLSLCCKWRDLRNYLCEVQNHYSKLC